MELLLNGTPSQWNTFSIRTLLVIFYRNYTRELTFENIVALTYLALLGGVEAEHEYMLGHLLATAARSLLSVY